MQENRMFSEMRKAAVRWLSHHQPKELAERANVHFDGSAFHLSSLGIAVTVSYPDYRITPELEPWHQLVILQALTGSKL